MIGRICVIFKGHTLESCLNMTKTQIRLLYGESFRQEAREKLKMLSLLKAAQSSGDEFKSFLFGLRYQAFPPDPETDGDMDDEKLLKAKETMIKAGFMNG